MIQSQESSSQLLSRTSQKICDIFGVDCAYTLEPCHNQVFLSVFINLKMIILKTWILFKFLFILAHYLAR